MKNKILLLISLLALTAAACNLPILTSPRLQVTATLPPFFNLTPQATNFPQDTFTPEPSPTFTATPKISPTPPTSIIDPLAGKNDQWEDPWIVTTQANRQNMQTTVGNVKGALVFNLLDKETYIYQFYKNPMQANVSLQVTYQSSGSRNDGIALACRATPDHSAWYEIRLNSHGQFQILRYDRSRKENGDQNPYISLKIGALKGGAFNPESTNQLRFNCVDSTLTLDINGGAQIISVQDDALNRSGMVGMGAMSGADVPVKITFRDFSANIP